MHPNTSLPPMLAEPVDASAGDRLGAASLPDLAGRVIGWQAVHGRHGLPWQTSREPYRVWLSEVMLQQTQVSTVLDYYPRFLACFPDVQALAAAPLDAVLALWSGLGYYSRARNLHRCAQQVVQQHGGRFPASSAALAELPGIGRSTAAAVAAFCFNERAAILDGNVKRVLTRALGFDGDLASARQTDRLWLRAEALLPERQVDTYTQGLMDLGATVCTLRRPRCLACPLQAGCVALAEGRPTFYPVKTRKARRGQRSHALLLLRQGSRVWLTQRPPEGVWAGLWSLPDFEDAQTLESHAAGWPGEGRWLPPLKHALTHFDWTLQPLHWRWPLRAEEGAAGDAMAWHAPPLLPGLQALPAGRWFEGEEALALGLPAPVRRLIEQT